MKVRTIPVAETFHNLKKYKVVSSYGQFWNSSYNGSIKTNKDESTGLDCYDGNLLCRYCDAFLGEVSDDNIVIQCITHLKSGSCKI